MTVIKNISNTLNKLNYINYRKYFTYCNYVLIIIIVLFVLLLVFKYRKTTKYTRLDYDNLELNKLQLQQGKLIKYSPYYYGNNFKNITNKTNNMILEGFEDNIENNNNTQLKINDVKIGYEFNTIAPGIFPETIYERSIENIFKDDIILKCSLTPTKKANDCLINGLPLIKYKFPVSITKLIDGTILSVFNDGRIYYKKNILDNLWSGPIKNSFPLRKIPLRMITTTPDGSSLIAVGYDNKVYRKSNIFDNNRMLLDKEWTEVYGLENIIYVMFNYNATTHQNRWLVIDINGKMKMTNTDKPNSGLIDFSVLRTPILKMFYDLDDYLCVIDTNFRIQTFDKKDWMNSQLSTKFQPSNDRVLDVVYDNDKMLFGLVLDKKNKSTDIRKQEEYGHNTKFVEFKFHKSLDSRLNRLITDGEIIKTKVGIFNIGVDEENTIDNDLNLAHQRQMLNDKQRLREFCKSRNFNANTNIKDYNLEKFIHQNNLKIEKIKEFLQTLKNYDSSYKNLSNNNLDSISKTTTL